MKSDTMNLVMFVLTGWIFCYSKGDIFQPDDLKSWNHQNPGNYTTLKSGSRISFHTTENEKLLLGPKLKSNGNATVFCVFKNPSENWKKAYKYTLLKSGVLVPDKNLNKYNIGNNQEWIYKTETPTYYRKGFKDILIPADMIYSKAQLKNLYRKKEDLHDEVADFTDEEKIIPDKSCNGDVTLFILKSDGVFKRKPSDPYLPLGMKILYNLMDNLVFKPSYDFNEYLVEYSTGENGDLIPSKSNKLDIKAEPNRLASFMLDQKGLLFPVLEEMESENVNYYYNGKLIHKSRQFSKVYTNSSTIVINNEKYEFPAKGGNHRIRKRQAGGYYNNQYYGKNYQYGEGPYYKSSASGTYKQPYDYNAQSQPAYQSGTPTNNAKSQPCTSVTLRNDVFAYDTKGNRISIIPELTECNDVVIYKLTCKGNLVRYPSCTEPEYGFEVNFQLLLDEFILIPIARSTRSYFTLTYTLQENGDLIPVKTCRNTFIKAPGSLLYFMLGKNNVMFPIQQIVNPDNTVCYYYQDYFLINVKNTKAKPVQFSTKPSPIFALVNNVTMITCSSKPRVSANRGSNWRNHRISTETEVETCTQSVYLVGPQNETIQLVPYKTKKNLIVIYELDCNGILYRSPKDKKKCIILKSYLLVKERILIPTNDTSDGYVYAVGKNGDMYPYLFPTTKLAAPPRGSQKYLLCQRGILVPIKVELISNYICYLFCDNIIYQERTFCRSGLESSEEVCSYECDNIQKDPNGYCVYYQKHFKVLKRYPPENVPSYLANTVGSFELKLDGSLFPTTYRNPDLHTINLRILENGDLEEVNDNVVHPVSRYWVLGKDGKLIAANAKPSTWGYTFYTKEGRRICKVRKDGRHYNSGGDENTNNGPKTPSGQDPLGLLNDPEPKKQCSKGPESIYIPIPLKSLTVSDGCDNCEDQQKCQKFKKNFERLVKGCSVPVELQLEMTEDFMRDMHAWASKYPKIKERRDVMQNLHHYLHDLEKMAERGI